MINMNADNTSKVTNTLARIDAAAISVITELVNTPKL